eukprot:4613789-Pleurochrysis_carterae.AAC.1
MSSATQIAELTAPTQVSLTNDGNTEVARSKGTTPARRPRAAADDVAYTRASAASKAGLSTCKAGDSSRGPRTAVPLEGTRLSAAVVPTTAAPVQITGNECQDH